jgi:hypothetical protein
VEYKPREQWVEVDVEAIVQNLREVRTLVVNIFSLPCPYYLSLTISGPRYPPIHTLTTTLQNHQASVYLHLK